MCMLIELLSDVPVLIGKRKWWVGFGKTVNEPGLCLFTCFKSGPKVAISWVVLQEKRNKHAQVSFLIFRHQGSEKP